jgi:hypothetical protein
MSRAPCKVYVETPYRASAYLVRIARAIRDGSSGISGISGPGFPDCSGYPARAFRNFRALIPDYRTMRTRDL